MQALVLLEKDAPLYHGEWDDPRPGEGETVVHLRAAALNRRDVFITQGLYPGIHYPVILGSDGAGTLDDGRKVLINPAMGWGDDPRTQSRNFSILGLPRDGTFAERVVMPKEKIYNKPTHLSWEAAAALPLTGVTAYRALFNRGKLRENDRVLISGIGGGVALFLFQFAMAAGARVWVTSGSEKKIERAVGMGARGGANYKAEDWPEQLKKQAGGFDLIVDGAGGPGFGNFLKLCRPAARIVIYGGTLGKLPPLSPQIIFWKQLSILGSTMGTDAEFAAMLEFVTKHKIEPVIDKVFPLSEGQKAFERMEKGLQFGKIVLKM